MKHVTQGNLWRSAVVIAAITVWFAMPGFHTAAFAQAGATGGVIGKQNKDASGGSDAAPAPRRQPRAVAPKASTSAGAAALAGHWRIEATCSNGLNVWSFDLRNSSNTDFTGDYNPGGGKVVDGKLTGNAVSITTAASITRHWTGTLSRPSNGLTMTGTMTGFGDCSFVATKS